MNSTRPPESDPATFLPPRLCFTPAGACPDCGAYRSDGKFPALHLEGCAFAHVGFDAHLGRLARGER